MSTASRQVFLSYGSEDDHVPPVLGGEVGWVSCFEQILQMELQQAGHLELEIWRDKGSLQKWRDLEESIEEALEDCEVFIGVVSPVYVKKPWCKREVEWFHGRLRDDARMFKVVKRPLANRDDEPPSLRNRSDIEMYRKLGRTNQYDDFYHPGKGKPAPEFYDQIRYLVDQIAQSLANVPRPRAIAPPDGDPPAVVAIEAPVAVPGVAPDAETVFVGEAAPELLHFMRKVEGALESLGMGIGGEATSATTHSIHMIGGEIDAVDLTILRHDLDAAKGVKDLPRDKLARFLASIGKTDG